MARTAPRRRRAVVLLATAGVLLASPAAAEDATWSVRPLEADAPVVALTVHPGDERRDAVVVTNEGDEPLTLAVTASDTREGDGGLEVADTRSGPGAWLVVPDRLDLAPGEEGDVPVHVAVPEGTEPGEYVAAVVTSLAERGGGVTVERRLALRVVVTVPDTVSAWRSVGPLVVAAAAVVLVVAAVTRGRARRP